MCCPSPETLVQCHQVLNVVGAAVKQLIFTSTTAASNAMLYLLQLAAQRSAIKPSKGGTYLYSTTELHTFPEGKGKKKEKQRCR